jgi:hypothetical protein
MNRVLVNAAPCGQITAMRWVAMTLMLLAGAAPTLAKPIPSHDNSARAKSAAPAPRVVKPATPSPQPALNEIEPTSATSECSKALREIAEFTPLPDRAGPGECGTSDRLQLDRIKMPDGSRVAMSPPATLRCRMAQSFAEWVRDDLGQAVRELGSPLKSVVAGSYECRPRNGLKGAKMSEHGRGNAVDVAALKLANNTVIDLTRPSASKEFRDKARASACSRFTTVLGPGADAQHENHIHVDLAERSRSHRLCQWDVREEPAVASAQPGVPPTLRSAAAAKTASSQIAQGKASAHADGRARPSRDEPAVPLPLRRPFELVFAARPHSYR